MNQKTLLKSVFVILFISFSLFSQANAQDISKVGVSVGDSFNYKVTQNDFSSNSYNINVTELASFYNLTTLASSSEYDFSSLANSLNASLLPGVGDVFGVKVLSLPDTATSLSGKLEFNYGSMSKNVTTGFFIGTPVVFKDWSFWKTFLYSLNNQTSEPTVTPGVYNNTQTFNATLSIHYSTVPKELDSFDSLTVNLEAYYDAVTGVLNSEMLQIVLANSQLPEPVTQTFSFARTVEPVTANTSSKLTSSGPVPGFEFIALLGGLSVLSVFIIRKRK